MTDDTLKTTAEEYSRQGVPVPGSKGAQVLGCLCPVIDNCYGGGYHHSGEFVVNEDCPLHGVSK